MSIDTSMYALLNNAPNPAASFSQGLQAGQQNKLARMQMEQATAQAAEAKQAKEQKNRLAQLLGMPENYDTGGNLKREALPQIAAIDPAQYPTYQKQIADQAKAVREQEKAELAAKREQFTTYGQIIGSARDQASYERALGALQRMGVDVSKESPTFDPNAVQQALQMTLTGAQQVEQTWKQKGYDLDVAKFGETVRNNKAQNGIAQGNLAVSQGQLGVAQGNLGVAQGNLAVNVQKAGQDKAAAAKSTEQQKAASDANSVLGLLDMAEPLLKQATNSYAGTALDKVAQAVGVSTEGAQAGAQLKALEGSLVAKMPKMSGPQSDKDVLLYRQMAGQIGDSTLPAETRMAAVKVIRQLNQKYVADNGGTPQQRVADAVNSGEVTKLANARPVSVKSAADYAKLPSGTVYMAPDGSMRTKQ